MHQKTKVNALTAKMMDYSNALKIVFLSGNYLKLSAISTNEDRTAWIHLISYISASECLDRVKGPNMCPSDPVPHIAYIIIFLEWNYILDT